MLYTLQVTAEPDSTSQAVRHRPISIETVTTRRQDVGDREIAMVAEAFRQQLADLLIEMARRE